MLFPKNHMARWSKREIDFLRDSAGSMTADELASTLQRSVQAVVARCYKMGVSISSRKSRERHSRLQLLAEWMENNRNRCARLTVTQVATILSYSSASYVTQAARVLGYDGYSDFRGSCRAEIGLPLLSGERDASDWPNVRPIKGKEYVYIIRASDAYKIGVSSSPRDRVNNIQQCCPLSIVWVAISKALPSDGAYHLESELHASYAHRVVRGEWFRLEWMDLAAINEEYPDIDFRHGEHE